MKSLALAAFLGAALGLGAAHAQDAGAEADHQALRQLKADVVDAINTRNLARMDTILHKPFLATVITQDSFSDAAALKAYFEGLFSRSIARIARIHMEAEADELSQIYTGTFAVARGSAKERYELADGRGFDMNTRWTATALKENGRWTVLAIHDGTNFLDNPVLDAIERHTLTVAGAAAAAGALAGFLIGFFVRRRRPKVA
jgi:ketosteroid isomerase-like protein